MSPMELPQRLKDLRMKAGMTQQDLAGVLGTTAPTICKIESGSLVPKQDLIEIWACVCLQRPVKFIYERGMDGSRAVQLV